MRYLPRIDPDTGATYLPVAERGQDLLNDPLLNKGTAFTDEERELFGLRGLLPAHVSSMAEQLLRVRSQFDNKGTDLERHIYLAALHDRNETLLYRFIADNLTETVPIMYTPTVAEACRHWSQIFRKARGTYVTPRHRGRIYDVLANRHAPDARVVVVTDNERILGIGDQGAGGMGIPIGKLALYTAAGVHPAWTVPISLDVGTDNEQLLADPIYLGLREPRLRGDEYWDLVNEFVLAIQEVFPHALLQWEDFANRTSMRLLETYRQVLPSFNDDIQGTAAMVLGGLLSAARLTGTPLAEQTVVLVGAGSAGAGIRRQIVAAMVDEGIALEAACSRVFVLDSHGLVVRGRDGVTGNKLDLAMDPAALDGWDVGDHVGLLDVVRHARPGVLIGVSGRGGLFDEQIIREVGSHVKRPIILPLSNPTANTEVTPEHAIAWTEGRAIVATGSPFPDVSYDGRRRKIGQANNVFVFPGVGLGVIASKAGQVTTGMFVAAARTLAAAVDDDLLALDCLYPPIDAVRKVSRDVAVAVARRAVAEGVAPPLDRVEVAVDRTMWYADYLPYRPV